MASGRDARMDADRFEDAPDIDFDDDRLSLNSQFNRLQKAIAVYQDSVGTLEATLQPLLMAAPAEGGLKEPFMADEKKATADSKLVTQVGDYIEQLDATTHRLRKILDRVQL